MDTKFIALYILVIAIGICVFMVVCFSEISSEIDDLKKQKQKPKEANRTLEELEEIEHSYGVVYCKECELIDNCPIQIDNCPIQKEKDEKEGNPFKEILGCCNGVRGQ